MMSECVYCQGMYHPEARVGKYTLRLIYCSIFCEIRAIGCSVEDLEKMIIVTGSKDVRMLEACLS